jgi:N-hydroxyarylamine O-acetyltransferase
LINGVLAIKSQAITIEDYLDRIAYTGSLTPTLFNLNQLHLAHMQTVPFENLDITLGRRINLELPVILDKIVNQKRGGFCYELNGAFAWLLREIGFRIEFLSARVYDGSAPGPKFAHMLLLVNLDQPVIADVGFGDSFLMPIIPGGSDCFQFDRYYRLLNNEKRWLLQQRFEVDDWQSKYTFDMKSHPLHAFDAMCHYHQTSKSSRFTSTTVCSRVTKKGRITYASGRLINNDKGFEEETRIENIASLDKLLQSRFGINLGARDLKQLIAATADH